MCCVVFVLRVCCVRVVLWFVCVVCLGVALCLWYVACCVLCDVTLRVLCFVCDVYVSCVFVAYVFCSCLCVL